MQLSVVCADELCVAFGAGLALHVFCSRAATCQGKECGRSKIPVKYHTQKTEKGYRYLRSCW